MRSKIKDNSAWKDWFVWYPICVRKGTRTQWIWWEWVQVGGRDLIWEDYPVRGTDLDK